MSTSELNTATKEEISPKKGNRGKSVSSTRDQNQLQAVAPFVRSPDAVLANPRIMIVDDQPINIKVVRKYLAMNGYQDFVTTTEPRQALPLIRERRPDLVLLDIMMPEISGLDILETVRGDERLFDVPVIILTASTDGETKRQALNLGATDFLNKPVDPADLIPRIRNSLAAKAFHDNIKRYASELEREVSLRTAQLEKAQQETIHCLARAAEYRDDDTGNHIIRVGRYAAVIGRALELKPVFISLLEQAAALHDIGKIGIPDSILLKPGKLDASEFGKIRQHCNFGYEIVGAIGKQPIDLLEQHDNAGAEALMQEVSPVLRMAAVIALTHHERWDGSGYPRGLAGEDIPLEGRITSVADVFDALGSPRPYKPAFSFDKCLENLENGRGTQFDPAVLDAFHSVRDETLEIRRKFADTCDCSPVDPTLAMPVETPLSSVSFTPSNP